MFFVRDPVKFPSLSKLFTDMCPDSYPFTANCAQDRSHKRHPATNASNADMFWDFHINNQESIHALMFLFGDRGLPSSVRHVNAYSGNTYKFAKSDGSYHYVRIHFITNQGIHYFTNSEAAELAGTDPDRHLLDLQGAIDAGDFPSWDVHVQVIHPNDIAAAPIDIFDMTKVWPKDKYPLRKAGRMVLDRNPQNWFAEIEQAAFSPSNMVPGIEPSPDPMLQARMFAYPDASRYRLGVNYQFLPTNAPRSEVYCPIERDGFMNFTKNYASDPNYIGTKLKPVKFLSTDRAKENGKPDAPATDDSQKPGATSTPALDQAHFLTPISFASTVGDKDFEQATALWHIMGKQEGAQERLVNNTAAHISGVKEKWIRDEAYGGTQLLYH